MTFYKSTAQLPDFEDYSMKNRTYRYFRGEPLFPFGHGLSYTRFEYGDARVDKPVLSEGETLTLTIPVSNVGGRDGDEVVQVYLRRPGDADGPLRTLRAFRRVNIAKGETSQVTLELPYERFEWFDAQTNTVHPLAGQYELLYGGTSAVDGLKAVTVEVK